MDPMTWSYLLLALALVLMVLELFIPSAGVLGVFAALSLAASLFIAFGQGVRQGTTVLLIAMVLIPVVLVVMFKTWPHTPIGRRILIPRPKHQDDVLPETAFDLKKMIGKFGRAKTKLLPSGAVVIEGRTYDAISQGLPIDPGQNIQVVDVRTNRIIVRLAGTPPPVEPGDVLSQPIDTFGLDPFDDPLA